jgi:hypothetical protein
MGSHDGVVPWLHCTQRQDALTPKREQRQQYSEGAKGWTFETEKSLSALPPSSPQRIVTTIISLASFLASSPASWLPPAPSPRPLSSPVSSRVPMLSSPSLAPVVSIWFPLRLRRVPAPSSGAVPSALPPLRYNFFVSTDRYPGSDRYLVGRCSPIRGRSPVFLLSQMY